ncbi:ABC transporter permease [Secundilactobacillus similis]|uniref:ABC-type multidrug transport system, permease component n=1 Tax=Secundilactobacillus similis DSM 23365 = JCM 2765 TaxID=1423804 RepID=A0A0R2FED7_9LACO|nr:ABC transporter permease [Secundilactobacillus similis]KRN26824.1 ABC-type multidrug transport system, permease component [Secundilactobacillus similis DSM 23365 = JCM 2765]
MRAIAIMNRVLKELLRDKRTLAMMFLAPILVLWLMSVIFTANSTTSVKVATVGVTSSLNTNLDNVKHVQVHKYDTQKSARQALKDQKVDAIIREKKDNHFTMTYANTDSSKTSAVKMAFSSAMTATNVSKMKTQLGVAQKTIATLQKALPTAMQQQLQAKQAKVQSSQAKSATPKITSHYVYGDADTGFFDKMLPILMGFFVFFFVFLISGMALLKERTSGTLSRLLATPVKRSEIVLGYMLSYGILAVFQTLVIVFATIWLLGVDVVGNVLNIVVINLILALVALAFGILLSTFARSEFQMMQFIPVVVIPQVFFSGIIPMDSMAHWIQDISYIIPIKYAGDAVTAIMMRGENLSSLGLDIGVLLIFLVVLTIGNVLGLRRYRKV